MECLVLSVHPILGFTQSMGPANVLYVSVIKLPMWMSEESVEMQTLLDRSMKHDEFINCNAFCQTKKEETVRMVKTVYVDQYPKVRK